MIRSICIAAASLSLGSAVAAENLITSAPEINPVCMDRTDVSDWFYDADSKILCLSGAINYAGMYAFEADMLPLDIDLVVLNSTGGTESGAIMIARLIAERELDTYIPPGAECKSACVPIFAAGKNRYLGEGVKPQVHFVWNHWVTRDVEGNRINPDEDAIQLHYDRTVDYFDRIAHYTGAPSMSGRYIDTMVRLHMIQPLDRARAKGGYGFVIRDRMYTDDVPFPIAAFVPINGHYLPTVALSTR